MQSTQTPESLLTPMMKDILMRMDKANRPALHTLSPLQARESYDKASGILELPSVDLERVEDRFLRSRDGHDLPCRLYAPNYQKLPILLYFHGGGFTIGSIQTHDVLCRNLSSLAECAVISVAYRLAPEYVFPVAHNDAWDSLLCVKALAANWGLDGERIAVGGDSAGGTLAAACAIEAVKIKLMLCLQVLFYPGCAANQDTQSHQMFAKGFLLEKSHIDYFFNQYLRSPSDRLDWRFSPLNATDIDGVAPAWIGLAECDSLFDEGIMYADKLRSSGVNVDLEIYKGVVHEFIKMGRVLPEAKKAHSDVASALRVAFEIKR